MKTYTLTWKHSPYFGSTLSRCRFEYVSPLWPIRLWFEPSAIIAFMHLCCINDALIPYRLSSCGRLVARSATYQGV